jgi:hypothetical protein
MRQRWGLRAPAPAYESRSFGRICCCCWTAVSDRSADRRLAASWLSSCANCSQVCAMSIRVARSMRCFVPGDKLRAISKHNRARSRYCSALVLMTPPVGLACDKRNCPRDVPRSTARNFTRSPITSAAYMSSFSAAQPAASPQRPSPPSRFGGSLCSSTIAK